MTVWTNDDDLKVNFGTREGTPTKAGQRGGVNHPYHIFEADIDLTDVGASAAALDNTVKIPQNAVLVKAEIQVLVEPTGTSAALDIGLMDLDGSERDYDGIIDGVTEAGLDDTVGATYVFEPDVAPDTGAVGALMGVFAAVSEPCYVSAMYTGAAFTAGRIVVRVYYTMPLSS